MHYLRRSHQRGPSDLGWLQSRHSFSFAGYYDPAHNGVSVLRVINDDQVRPGAGFATHSHQDMEIISYVRHGRIEHKDSLGNIEVLPAGEFQLMSAGTGVTHSEYNPSADQPLAFLQIWIEPNQLGVAPGYQQKHFGAKPGLTAVVTPDGRDGTLCIHQDASLYQLRLDPGQAVDYPVAAGRTLYVHLIAGELAVNSDRLAAGDGIGLAAVEAVVLRATTACEALLFDLP